MRTKDKVKMCPYCEGSISILAEECKYCGSSLAKKSTASRAYQTEDSLASLYEPPYAPSRKSAVYGVPEQEASSTSVNDPMAGHYEEEEEENPILRSVPKPKRSPRKTSTRKKSVNKEEEEEEQAQIGSLLLLSLGGHLFTLAWLLFFFSDHGKLVLEWKSRYWFVYLILSVPLIYKGWKKLSED